MKGAPALKPPRIELPLKSVVYFLSSFSANN
jgi:hypothetical protein